MSQQADSADITKNSAVGKIMQYLNHEYRKKHIYSTRKGLKARVREKTVHLATLKSNKNRS
jgi:hypothetical protein